MKERRATRSPAGWILIAMALLAIAGIGEFVAKVMEG
jgi:hypothetical protein